MTALTHGKYHIWTVGCQMNQADSQRVSSILDRLGWEEVPEMDAANLVVLNTCSVREQPERRAHGQLSLLAHAKKHRENLLVAMMGCMIGNARQLEDLKHRYPVVDLFFKVEQADILPRFLDERWTPIAGEGCVDVADLGAPRTIGVSERLPVLPMPPEPIPTSSLDAASALGPGVVASPGSPSGSGVRSGAMAVNFRPGARELHYPTTGQVGFKPAQPTAWLPVILGCNKVCSYCIVPSRRGRERSRPLDELLTEARELVDGGARELTLLGQTVEAYGLDLPDQREDLGDLMERLSAIDGLERIRFMTSYPRHFTDKMIHQMAALPKVCEHVNIPVQHGDDGMLTRMRRGYTLAEYRALIERLRAWWPGVSLSTDVIVGFCGETDDEFQRTLDLIEEIRFDVVHVAAYSPRPGTLSFKWEDDVPLAVKRERLHAVEQVQERIARELNVPYLDTAQEVLVEAHQVAGGEHQWRGRTRTNKLVFFPAGRPPDAPTDAASRASRAGRSADAPTDAASRASRAGRPPDAPTDGSPSPDSQSAQADVAAEGPRGAVSTAGRSRVRPGDLVTVQIDKTTPWSLQGYLLPR